MNSKDMLATDVQGLTVEDLAFEELGEFTGAGSASTVGTVSTPASAGTAACLSCF